MNKKFSPLFFPALIGLVIFGLFARLTASVYRLVPWLNDTYWWVHLIIPLVLMGVALALHLTAKGRTAGYLLSYLFNAIGSGCLVGAIYGIRNYIPAPELLIALIPAFLICATACLIPLLPSKFWKELTQIILLVLAIGLVVTGMIVWIFRSMPFGCAFLFSGLFILPFPLVVFDADVEWSQRSCHLSYSGFGAFILVISVAAFILSEGEILDGLDLGDFGGSGRKKGK